MILLEGPGGQRNGEPSSPRGQRRVGKGFLGESRYCWCFETSAVHADELIAVDTLSSMSRYSGHIILGETDRYLENKYRQLCF